MNIDVNLMLTISSGILLAFIIKHIINIALTYFQNRAIRKHWGSASKGS